MGFVVARWQAADPSAVYTGKVADSAWQFLDGLLGNELDGGGSWRSRPVARRSWGRGQWDTDALRNIMREYAMEMLGDEDVVLVIDETGF
ncbi:hypothetical protein CWO91_41015 [Bradyrhizobium genosp. SA-3]|nr:hypothetical protein CWO91_41015 [Bradyrhizobium genosp. SA-3]